MTEGGTPAEFKAGTLHKSTNRARPSEEAPPFRNGRLAGRLWATRGMALAFSWMLCAGLASAAEAATKVAVFPTEISIALQQDDIMGIPKKATPEEVHRLEMVTKELKQLLQAEGRYEVVDTSPMAAEIEKAAPLRDCNGCAAEITRKLGAQLAVTAFVDKTSATLLNLNIFVTDTAAENSVRGMSVMIAGNTDNAWLRGVRWLVKNRLLAAGKEATP
jgi:hypothetical protein